MGVTIDTTNSPVALRAKRKVYANIIFPAFLISIIAYLDRNNLSYAKLTMNADLGFTEDQYGLGAGIFFVGYLLFEIPGALVAERYSAKWWLARIMISWGLLTGLMALVAQPWQYYVLRFLIGVAEASLYPVLYATVIPRWFAAADRARAIAAMLTSLQVSAIIGAPLAGWLIDQSLLGLKGWQVLFLVEALPAVVLGVIVVYWLADWPADARWLRADEAEYLVQQYEHERHERPAARLTVAQALADKEVLKLSGTYFLWMTAYWGFNYFTPSVLKNLGWSHQAIGWLVAANMVVSLLVMVGVGHSSSRSGEKRWHGASGMFLAAIGMFGAVFVLDPFAAYGCLSLAGVGICSALGVWWSYPTTFLRGPAAAGAVGLINSVGSSGGFVGLYLTGYLKVTTDSYATAWTCLSIGLVGAGCLILTFREPPKVAAA